MHSISLVFEDDVQRDDIETLKAVRGCMGVSAYKNTVNLYFRKADRTTIAALALAVHRVLVTAGATLATSNATFDSATASRDIYSALQAEAMS